MARSLKSTGRGKGKSENSLCRKRAANETNENDTLIYRYSEYLDIKEYNVSSYVIDTKGDIYVLRPTAEDYMDWERVYLK